MDTITNRQIELHFSSFLFSFNTGKFQTLLLELVPKKIRKIGSRLKNTEVFLYVGLVIYLLGWDRTGPGSTTDR